MMSLKMARVMLALSIILVLFNNCTEASFSGRPSQQEVEVPVDPPVEPFDASLTEDFNLPVVPRADKVDILFIIDESISMNTIINNVVAGFNSLQGVSYPADTLMAVTNMAPARIDDQGFTLYDEAFIGFRGSNFDNYGLVSDYPGFIRLVSEQTLLDFHLSNSAMLNFYNNKFQLAGCQEWFAPLAQHTAGHRCLEAATQIAASPTGVEAGIMTLKQLLFKKINAGEKLFRDNALVNIIFVSDTHDSGANYYGAAGAQGVRTPFVTMNSAIRNTHSLYDLKFSAIAPVPWVGNPYAQGLKIIGNQSQGELEFNNTVNGEKGVPDMYEFAYAQYAKQSGGVVVDPYLTNDWGPAMADLVRQTTNHIPEVILSSEVGTLEAIIINGVELDLIAEQDKYMVNGNRIRFPGFENHQTELQVQVRYIPK